MNDVSPQVPEPETGRGPHVASILRATLAQRPALAEEGLLVFHDLAELDSRLGRLRDSFPPRTVHAVAIKANPVLEILRHATECGAGLEAASYEELMLAVHAGCPPERIVFDSPAKTRGEIADALDRGVILNADSFDELERIHAALGGREPAGRIGLRINPQIGGGRIAITSVATRTSKFGVPLSESEAQIVDCFRRFDWLTGLHIHVGSQGCSLEQLVHAAREVDGLMKRLRAELGPDRVRTVDIGGGLPYPYTSSDREIDLDEYLESLRRSAPLLFDSGVGLVTEFGRWLQAGCGWIAARVEYVKRSGGQNIAVCHAGADLLMRVVYQPETWRHRFSVLGPGGGQKATDGAPARWTVAGPLCFAGDIILRDAACPDIQAGDWLVLHDTGAYTLSMWSRHCSRRLPSVIGYRGDDSDSIRVLLARESIEDLVGFWGR